MARRTYIDLQWDDNKLQKNCSSDAAGRRHFGADNWKVLRRRIAALEAADRLADLDGLPGKCHQLHGDRSGSFAVHLWGSYRLVFVPDHDPLPQTTDSGVDRLRVTKIKITEVVDYHGR